MVVILHKFEVKEIPSQNNTGTYKNLQDNLIKALSEYRDMDILNFNNKNIIFVISKSDNDKVYNINYKQYSCKHIFKALLYIYNKYYLDGLFEMNETPDPIQFLNFMNDFINKTETG